MTWEDARSAIDAFYEESENLRIPVSNALEIVAMRAKGDPEQRIQRIVVMQRRASQTPPPQQP